MNVYSRRFVIWFCIVFAHTCAAQFSPTRILGPEDAEIPIPGDAQAAGRVDAGALQVLLQHLRTVGTTAWAGMRAEGALTYIGSGGPPLPAELLILEQNTCRLDVSTSQGIRSTIMHAGSGAIKEPDGSLLGYTDHTAELGLIQFPLVRQAPPLSPTTSLLDEGMVTIKGTSLHRIAMVTKARTRGNAPAEGSSSSQRSLSSVVVDFYFDPSTNLLVKSVSVVRLPGAGTENFLRVLTYADYRQVNNVLLPFQIKESLSGEPQWVLNLSQVEFTSNTNPTVFDF